MTSLFSSFDSSIFLFSFFITSIFIFSMFMNSFYLHSYFHTMWGYFFMFFSKFFNNLVSSNMSKGLENLFIFLLISLLFYNSFSIFPFIFPWTSQVSIILFSSLSVWGMIFIFGMFSKPKKYLSHFIPEGSPFILSFFLFLIELISALIRPLTLTVRLVANILAGHLLIILLSSMIFNFSLVFPLLSFLNLIELFVSLIQAYIFSTLVTLYFSEN